MDPVVQAIAIAQPAHEDSVRIAVWVAAVGCDLSEDIDRGIDSADLDKGLKDEVEGLDFDFRV